MAESFDSPSGGTAGGMSIGSTSLTYAFNNVAGDFLTVAVFNVSTDGTPSATYNGVSMTLIDTQTFGTRRVTVLGLAAPATGSHNVVVTQTGTTFLYSCAASHGGASATGQPDSSGKTSTSGTSISPSTTVVGTGCWLIMAVAGDNGNNPVAGSGTTLRSVKGTDSYIGILDSNGAVSTGSQSLNASFSPTSQNIGAVIFSLAPAASGSIFVPKIIMS